jgi:hypothetical protein
MNASWDCGEKRRDDFAGKLADTALVVTAQHGVRGPSVERELELWHSLGDVVRDTGCAPGREEALLARLTDAAYRVALAHGTPQPFVDLELDLWRSLRRALAGRAAPSRQ